MVYGAWHFIPLMKGCLQHVKFVTKTNNQIRTVFSRNFLDCLQPEISSFLLFRVHISGLQIIKYFSNKHELHFLVTFVYDFACFTLHHVMVYFMFLSFKFQIYLLSSIACL